MGSGLVPVGAAAVDDNGPAAAADTDALSLADVQHCGGPCPAGCVQVLQADGQNKGREDKQQPGSVPPLAHQQDGQQNGVCEHQKSNGIG